VICFDPTKLTVDGGIIYIIFISVNDEILIILATRSFSSLTI